MKYATTALIITFNQYALISIAIAAAFVSLIYYFFYLRAGSKKRKGLKLLLVFLLASALGLVAVRQSMHKYPISFEVIRVG